MENIPIEESTQNRSGRVLTQRHAGILLIVLVFLGLQLFLIDRPLTLIGDEIYYVP